MLLIYVVQWSYHKACGANTKTNCTLGHTVLMLKLSNDNETWLESTDRVQLWYCCLWSKTLLCYQQAHTAAKSHDKSIQLTDFLHISFMLSGSLSELISSSSWLWPILWYLCFVARRADIKTCCVPTSTFCIRGQGNLSWWQRERFRSLFSQHHR